MHLAYRSTSQSISTVVTATPSSGVITVTASPSSSLEASTCTIGATTVVYWVSEPTATLSVSGISSSATFVPAPSVISSVSSSAIGSASSGIVSSVSPSGGIATFSTTYIPGPSGVLHDCPFGRPTTSTEAATAYAISSAAVVA